MSSITTSSRARLAPMTLACLALIWAAEAVQAAPVLSADATASAGVTPAIPSPGGTPPTYVNSFAGITNPAGSGSAYSFASASGAYAVQAEAAGVATGGASASFENVFTNTSAVAQFYTLNFFIYGGSISTQVFDPAGLAGTEFLKAGYGASIKLNGTTVFSSTAELNRVGTGPATLTQSGTGLAGGTHSGDVYSWHSATYTVDLGLIGAGQTFTILAEVFDYAESNVGVYEFSSGCGGYGDVPTAVGSTNAQSPEPGGFKGCATAFYGDPLDLTGSANTSGPGGQFQLTTQAVPEPGSLALVAGALAALWGTRRGRRQRPAG